jgi:hypothetical protein
MIHRKQSWPGEVSTKFVRHAAVDSRGNSNSAIKDASDLQKFVPTSLSLATFERVTLPLIFRVGNWGLSETGQRQFE